ncbi:MAG: hypothetical protein ACFB0G_04610 [Leptolyngbyaceae cyanobacterium]
MLSETLWLYRRMSYAIPEDYVEWATQRLCEGQDSPSLRVLAGLEPKLERDEIKPYFIKACTELSLEMPLKAEEPRTTAEVIRKIYGLSNLPPERAIDMMTELYQETNHSDPILSVWFEIAEELSLKGSGHEGCFYPLAEFNSLDEVVKKELALFARASRLALPEDFMAFIKCDRCGYIGQSKIECKLSEANWHTCRRCNSSDYQRMTSPKVRDDYFQQIESSS